MEDSLLIDKVSDDLRSQIIDITKVSYFIDNTKTPDKKKLNSVLPKYISKKTTNIPILVNNIRDNII